MSRILLLAGVIILSGCGIKGPPLPPQQEETIQKQQSKQAGAEAEAKIASKIASKTVSADATKAKPPKKK